MCRECMKVMTEWDKENITRKDKIMYFGFHKKTDKLCTYHRKLKEGLIDPPDETEYSPKAKYIWKYRPFVYSAARKWSEITGIDFDDIKQEGMLCLAEIADKVDWEASPKVISAYISRCVLGYMKNYMAKMGTTVSLPHFLADAKTDTEILVGDIEGENELLDDKDTQEEVVIADAQKEELNKRIGRLMKDNALSQRERQILYWNILPSPGEKMSIRYIADLWSCGRTSISRDKDRVLKLLKEGDNENF